jgi:hypothetical protein
MSNELDPTDFDAVIGYYNIGSLDRQQEIWDRAITPERFAHMARVAAFKAGRGPDPGPWQGPPIDFEKALLELEEEEPYDPEAAEDECPPASAGPINCHGQERHRQRSSGGDLRPQ